MAGKKVKRIKVYDTSGNPLDIDEAQKDFWVGKGYTIDPPKQETTTEEGGK